MAVSRNGIVIEIIGDERSYLRAAANTIGANTKLDASFQNLSVNAKTSADAQVAAAVKASEALRVNALQMSAAAARTPAGSGQQAALVAAAAAQDKYNRSIGVSTRESNKLSGASKTVERDVGKASRGLLSGATAGLGFGRSLAFASGGFLAFAGASRLIRSSITDAENLQKAQAGLSVAIQKTGGNLAKLEPQYQATAQSAQQFGINQADALTGLERATVLTGDAAKAQRAYQEALVISKALGKDFNQVLTATAKGQEGITTSLKRYGIEIAKGASGTQQLAVVMSRFAGQAKANTTQADRFNATLSNSEAIIGTALLPVFDKYLGEFGKWLDKMNKSGRLQKDVNGVLQVAGDVFHTLGAVIGVVDRVTGGFVRTLEILAAFKFASVISGWISNLSQLATEWGLVRTAAIEADAAQGIGFGNRGPRPSPGGGGNLFPFLLGTGAGAAGAARAAGTAESGASRIVLPAGVDEATAAAAARLAAEGAAGGTVLSRILGGVAVGLRGALARTFAAGDAGVETQGGIGVDPTNGLSYLTFNGKRYYGNFVGIPGNAVITPQLRNLPTTGNVVPRALQAPGLQPPPASAPLPRPAPTSGPFGSAQPINVYKTFALTVPEQLTAARAALTKSTQDDVAAAKQVIARIKRLIDQGHLQGNSLIQALQAEASALGTIWSAETATAQKRAAAAAAAQARIQSQIDPLNLEVQLSRTQALGLSPVATLRALKASAQKALDSGKLTLDEQKQAWDQIASLNGQIQTALTTASQTFRVPPELALGLAKDQALGHDFRRDLLKIRAAILRFIRTHKGNIAALTDAYGQLASINQQLGTSTQSFQVPPALQLALAKDQALGRDSTKDLLTLRSAILKFIRTHKHNIAALTDAYNQLAQVNQQLGATAQSALGLFKQASTKALTAGLGLTASQRAALRARLSQLGPGGTVPGSGVGAAGYAIGADDKPIVVHTHINMDGQRVADNTTRHQQKRRRRNPSQRRGPNAGLAGA